VVSALLLALILTSVFVSVITTDPVQAETGQGADVFRVIRVDESKGDVIAIVTAKDEAAKVKLFDAYYNDLIL
jgi:hypothetical protein